MKDRYDISVDVGEGKDWWYIHGLATHDKVYELNRQMCDIGKTMNDPMESLSEDTERAMLGCCELLAKDASNAKRMMDDIVRRAEENIRLHNDNNKYARLVRAAYERKYGKPKEKDIMKEKKTKKMTKAEAFEYLKEKKIDASINEREIQLKLFSLGVVWCTLDSKPTLGVDYLLIDKECHMTHCGSDLDYYKTHRYEEISADDILSIEIVEEKKDDERKGEILEEIAKLGGKISDLIEEYGGDVIVEIDQYEVILRDCGDILYRK